MSDRILLRERPEFPRRFVPKGVDAQSWMGFEQRIQERRYNVLIETARAAIASHDIAAARAAIEEARELRPGAEDLELLEYSIDSVPAPPPLESTPIFRSRTFGAALMLVAGVSLLLAIDYVRPSRSSARVIPAPVMRLPGLRVPLPPVADIPHPATLETGIRTVDPFPIATSGLEFRLDGEVSIPASLRERSAIEPDPLPLPPGETPDDFVYPRTPLVPSSSRPVAPPITASRAQAEVAVTAAAAPAAAVVPGVTSSASPAAGTATSAVAAAPRPSPPASAPIGSFTPPATSPAPVVAPSSSSSAPAPPATPRSVIQPNIPVASAPTPSNPATFGVSRNSTTARPVASADDDAKVADVLRAYARAYGNLDASAARAVWPSVDERALARAFSTLSAQTLSFADCRIDVRGVSALASCRGYASYVGKVGGSGTRTTEARQWRFELRRVGDDWRIQNAEARGQ